MGVKFNSMLAKFPKSQEVEKLTDIFAQASKVISLVNVASWGNNFFVALFAAIVAFVGWQVYSANDYARQASESANIAVQKIEGGLYNDNGYSVLPNAKSSEAVYNSKHQQK